MAQGGVPVRRPVLTPATILAIEGRIAPRAGAVAIARNAAGALLRPSWRKFIPYLGQAMAISQAIDAARDAYENPEVDWHKLENEIYDAHDMAVFRQGFTEARVYFLTQTDRGFEAQRNNWNYILVPSQVMPRIAEVDSIGIEIHGEHLVWDPMGAAVRRRQATSGRQPARAFRTPDGPRLSWEEYPFAATRGLAPGVYIDLAPLRENWIQGGFIRAAAMLQNFRPNDSVRAIVL